MIAQLIVGLLVACSLFAQTQVELTNQVKGELPPDKGGTGVSSCLENEGLIWQSGEFACSALASGPHAPTHQDGGADEVATVTPSANAIPKSNADSTLSDGWLPGTISRDITWTGSQTFKQANGILLSTEFDWSQDPGTSLALGINTVTLTPCAAGVNGTNNNHYIYVDDANNALDESVLITGGTCTSEAASGTVQFTTSNSHTSGNYNLRSATAGIQEAIWGLDAVDPGNSGGEIYVQAGIHEIYAPLTLGDGTTTRTGVGAVSTVHEFVTIRGAGPGREGTVAPRATVLRWQGAGGTMVKIAGKNEGTHLIGMHLFGNHGAAGVTGPDILLELAEGRGGIYRDLMISNGAPGSAGIEMYHASQNRFEHIRIDNRQSGASGIIMCNSSDVFCTQNVFDFVRIWQEQDQPDAYGLYVGYADNNIFREMLIFPKNRTVSTVTCAVPVQLDIAIDHNLQTGDQLRVLNGQCSGSGVSFDGVFTITVVDSNSFTLDGTSESGTHSGLTRYGGPGSSLYLDCSKRDFFPGGNVFYHISAAFARNQVNSPSLCGSNFFSDFNRGDEEDLNIFNNTVGAAKMDPAFGFYTPDLQNGGSFWGLAGKIMHVLANDATTPYAMFFNDTGRVLLGSGISNSSSPAARLHIKDVGGSASGIQFENSFDNVSMNFITDSDNSNFGISYSGTGGIDLVIQSDGDIENQVGMIIAADGMDPGAVTRSSLPANGLVFCTNCNPDATCTSVGSGAWARCRSASCECNW